jgi:hypothetical protein
MAWVDAAYFEYARAGSGGWPLGGAAALLLLCLGAAQPGADYYVAVLEAGYINFYELSVWQVEEELEALGWALGCLNMPAAITVSALLSVACICVGSSAPPRCRRGL